MKVINAGGKEYSAYWTTGEVVSTGKNMETKVHGGGGGGYVHQGTGYSAPVSISSTTVVHDQLFLVDKNGKEHAFQLQDFNLACRATNMVTVFWAMKKGKERGPYVLVHNHTTGEECFQPARLKELLAPNRWLYLGGGIIGVLLLFKIFGGTVGFIGSIALIVGLAVMYSKTYKKTLDEFKSAISPAELLAG